MAFVGPLGVGKTTAVRSISDVPVLSTEVMRAAIAVRADSFNNKRTTTVGIDYGEWTTPSGMRVGVVGTPGQVRFSSTRTSVIARRGSIVLWLFGDHPQPVQQAAEWIERLGDASVWSRLVLAITRRPPYGGTDLAEFEACARSYHPQMKVLDADPRVREDVARIIITALDNPYPTSGHAS
ncbi:hypothetical protein KEM60_02436 [Austwickia sp. TVS 96-490-7B]|nr:hypothetical protein [Austwickia sp. TVS 96-490-7B]